MSTNEETGVRIQPPLTEGMILTFASSLALYEKIAPSTINLYISGLVKWHNMVSTEQIDPRPAMVKAFLKGYTNKYNTDKFKLCSSQPHTAFTAPA